MNPKSFLFFAICVQINSARSHELDDFIIRNLQNFTKWLNDWDPSEIITGPTRFTANHSLIDLECDVYISNYRVYGHSNESLIYFGGSSVEYMLFSSYIILTNNITVTGEHSSNVTFLSGIPIEGNGNWHITGSSVSYEFHMYIDVQPTGYLDLGTAWAGWSPIKIEELYFENMSDNEDIVGYEEYMKESLGNGFHTIWKPWQSDPIPWYYHAYWKEILRENTLEDIFGNKTLAIK